MVSSDLYTMKLEEYGSCFYFLGKENPIKVYY